MPGRRVFHLAFALYVATALGIVIPAHHYGHSSDGRVGHCELLAGRHCEEGHDRHEGGEEPRAPDSGHHDASTCSICLFARTLSCKPSPQDGVPTPDVVDITPADAPPPVAHSSFTPTLHGRAPPAAA